MAGRKIFNGGKARDLREEKNITVRELAELIEEHSDSAWSQDTIRNVELGHKQPGLKLGHAWANALDVDRSELLMDAPEDGDTP